MKRPASAFGGSRDSKIVIEIDDNFRRAKRNLLWGATAAFFLAFATINQDKCGSLNLNFLVQGSLLIRYIAAFLFFYVLYAAWSFWTEVRRANFRNSPAGIKDENSSVDDKKSNLYHEMVLRDFRNSLDKFQTEMSELKTEFFTKIEVEEYDPGMLAEDTNFISNIVYQAECNYNGILRLRNDIITISERNPISAVIDHLNKEVIPDTRVEDGDFELAKISIERLKRNVSARLRSKEHAIEKNQESIIDMIHALRSDMDSVINTYQAFSDKIQKGDLRDHFLLEQLFPFSYAAIALVTLIMTRHDCVLPLLS